MSASKIKRYPGGRPFTKEMSNLFFGRKEDLKKLYHLVSLEKLVVLHGRSGLGKSSLINAGLIPKLEEFPENECIQIRFNAWTETNHKSPLQSTFEELSQLEVDSSIINKLAPNEKSLWRTIKERQLRSSESRSILIFDQFEELFSYPEDQINKFKFQVAELIRKQIPKRFEQLIEIGYKRGSEVLSLKEEDQLYTDLNIRILFIIRSDKMHLLDKLSDYLPTIFKNNHELKALQIGGATDAIIMPAVLEGDQFISSKFEYTPAAKTKILNFLKDKDTSLIEAIQLQIVCTSFEENVIKNGWDKINEQNIGNLSAIVQNYYHNKIETLDTQEEKSQAAKLLEDGLVDNQRQQRLTLHESQIKDLFNVEQGLLDKLINIHLLRRELDQNGGYNYELSHDTLIRPALMAKEIREKKEQQEEAIKKEKELAEEKSKRRKAVLFSYGALALAILSGALLLLQLSTKAKLKLEAKAKEAQIEENLKQQKILEKTNTSLERQTAEAKRQKEEAEKQKEEALRQTEIAKRQKSAAEQAREEAINNEIAAKKAETEAEENLIKSIKSEKETQRLNYISDAKYYLSQGNRVQSFLNAKQAYQLDPSKEDIRLFIRELSRTAVPEFYVDKSQRAAKAKQNPYHTVITTSRFNYIPETKQVIPLDADEILFSNDNRFMLSIKFKSNGKIQNTGLKNSTLIHKGSGTIEGYAKATFKLYDSKSGKLITSFKQSDLFKNASDITTNYSQDELGFITPWNSCFIAQAENNEYILGLRAMKNVYDNKASWELTNATGNYISSFGDDSWRNLPQDYNTAANQVMTDYFTANRKEELFYDFIKNIRYIILPNINNVTIKTGTDEIAGYCREEEAFWRMQDWRGLSITEFKFHSRKCYESPSYESFVETEINSPCYFTPEYSADSNYDDLWESELKEGYVFKGGYSLFWDRLGNASIWDNTELRMSEYLPGEFKGYATFDDEHHLISKWQKNIYVWDLDANLVKQFYGDNLFIKDLNTYILQRNDTTAVLSRHYEETPIDISHVTNFRAFTENGYYVSEQGAGYSTGGPTNYNFTNTYYDWNGKLLEENTTSITSDQIFNFNQFDKVKTIDKPLENIEVRINGKNIEIYNTKTNASGQLVDLIEMDDFIYIHFVDGNKIVVVTEGRKVKTFEIIPDFNYDEYLNSKKLDYQF